MTKSPPTGEQISVLNQKLEVLLEAGGSAEDIGHLLLEIHGRHQALESIQADFLSQFVGQLVGEQRARYAAAHRAESLRPILPAFRRLRLFLGERFLGRLASLQPTVPAATKENQRKRRTFL